MKITLKVLSKILPVFLLIYSMGTYAQDKIVTGTITDAGGVPVPGANIIIKGTQTGTASDFDGNYSIAVNPGQTLVFSSIGFTTTEVPIGQSDVYNVQMEEDFALLNEVVVVGYGSTSRSDVTGAIVGVSAEEINSRPVNNPLEAMQGKAAGVDISSNERPGSVGSITIRGVRS